MLRCTEMSAVRFLVVACTACGRLGFDRGTDAGTDGDSDATAAVDRHLRVAAGWSIAPVVELTGVVPYNEADYMETKGAISSNEPSYIAALYPPFEASLAVIAGRSVIEIAADGGMGVHAYRPAKPDAAGPDVP